MTDTLEIFGDEFTGVTGIKATDDNNQTKTYIRPQGNINITQSGQIDVTNYATATAVELQNYTIGNAYEFYTENGARKWRVKANIANINDSTDGFIHLDRYEVLSGNYLSFNAVPSNTTITPTTSAQTIGGVRHMMEEAVTVEAMPSGTAGTPTATKGTVSNHSVSVTPSVTNTTGYITGSTKTGTAVTVSASELVSGTYTVNSSGTKDVTNYASVSVPNLTLPGGPSYSSSGTYKGAIAVDATAKRYLNIPSGYNDTAQYYEISKMNVDTITITTNGAYNPNYEGLDGYSEVIVNVSGGGGSSMQTDSVEGGTMSASTLTFTGLKGEPLYYSVTVDNNVTTGTPAKIAAITYDGTTLHGQTITNTTNAQVSYDGSSFSHSYSNGSLTITSTGASFVTGEAYFLDYAYGGTAANVQTEDVQVGSGVTSITFTGLEDEPLIWSCIFKSNFSSSSGYQRVIFVNKKHNDLVIGYAMDSSAHISNSYWTATYNNGSLTITSQGTNAGGYFHQPGYYQLTYVLGEASPYQAKTVTPTTSQQIVEPDTGYDALSRVTVNAIPSEYIIPTGNYAITANGTNINVAQYATVSVNVPSSGGANFATATMTNSSNQNTSISFTLPSGRTPKAFFVRLTSTIQRSSNSRYYYVFDMRWDGSSSGGVAGNCFYMYSGQLTDVTSGYSKSQSGTTYTLTSTGTRSASPGSFYNGTYEMVYVY